MREVFERLEALGLRSYMTGSEALARYSQPRQTMDVDIVVAITPARFGTIARAFEHDFRCAVRPDVGATDLQSSIAASTVDERVAWLAAMRSAGIRSAWQQVDRAGITEPLEVAEFLLRRLYPNESAAWFERVLEQLRAAQAAGTWAGFERPSPEHEQEIRP